MHASFARECLDATDLRCASPVAGRRGRLTPIASSRERVQGALGLGGNTDEASLPSQPSAPRRLQRLTDAFRIVGDDFEVSAVRLIGLGASLFPVTQGAQGDVIAR